MFDLVKKKPQWTLTGRSRPRVGFRDRLVMQVEEKRDGMIRWRDARLQDVLPVSQGKEGRPYG